MKKWMAVVVVVALAGGVAAVAGRYADKTVPSAPPSSPFIHVSIVGDCFGGAIYYRLYADLLGSTYRVHRITQNGQTTATILAHMQEWIIDPQPNVLVLNVGIHDLMRLNADSPPTTDPELFEAALNQILILTHRHSPNTRIIALPIIPTVGDKWESEYPLKRIEEYSTILRRVCADRGVEFMPLPVGTSERRDGLHLTDPGYVLVADEIARQIRGR